MRRHRAFGPVDFYRVARSRLGRHILSTGIYAVDGLLIDTGPANARSEVEGVLEEVGDPEQILLTHHHEDHVGNAAWIARRTGVRPLAHESAAERLQRPVSLPLYRRLTWGTPEPVRVRPAGDGVRTERFEFRVVHTPGHAEDHVVLHEPEQNWLFAGDLYVTEAPGLAFLDEDIGQIIASLRRILAIPNCVLFCQHTGPHAGHQHSLGRKLDHLLGLRDRVVVLHEEGRTVPEIVRELELGTPFYRIISRGELSGRNLVRQLLEDAGKTID